MSTAPILSRAEQIEAAFQRFHMANPDVWREFEKYAMQAIRAGHQHYSADAICHRIRWDYSISTPDEDCKLNDHYTAYFARMFHAAHPQHNGFFRNRKRTSLERAACHPDVQFFAGEPEVSRS